MKIRNVKKTGALALVAVVGLMAVSEPAHASLFGLFGKKKKKDKDKDKPQATQPYAQATPYPTYQQPTYQQPGYGSAPVQTVQIPASQPNTYGGGGYGRVNYGTLDAYADYLRFAQPSYNYR
ncbi:MAG: hypothetical protein EOP05_12275, partial [Proteobacteria bacterium]